MTYLAIFALLMIYPAGLVAARLPGIIARRFGA